MAGLGPTEIIVIVIVLALLLGWKRMPDAARSVGRSMRIFKSEVSEMKNDGQPSAASRETVNGDAIHENAPRTDNTSAPQNPTAPHSPTGPQNPGTGI